MDPEAQKLLVVALMFVGIAWASAWASRGHTSRD